MVSSQGEGLILHCTCWQPELLTGGGRVGETGAREGAGRPPPEESGPDSGGAGGLPSPGGSSPAPCPHGPLACSCSTGCRPGQGPRGRSLCVPCTRRGEAQGLSVGSAEPDALVVRGRAPGGPNPPSRLSAWPRPKEQPLHRTASAGGPFQGRHGPSVSPRLSCSPPLVSGEDK